MAIPQQLHRGHLITRQEDVEWLKAKRGRLARIIQASQMEANEMEQLGFITGQWCGNIPMLHLFHCIIEDDTKPLFLHRNDTCTRRELDQRNSSERPETVNEVIAKWWNDVEFNPTLLVMDCDDNFATAIDVRFESVKNMTPANANNVKDHLTLLCTNLIRVIQNWEQSGQGEGGHMESEGNNNEDNYHLRVPLNVGSSFGQLAGRSNNALANRCNFIQGKVTYLLYFWKLAHRHQLLNSTVQRLSDDSSTCDRSVVPSARSSISSRCHGREEDTSIATVAESIHDLAHVTHQAEVSHAARSRQEYLKSLHEQ